jgi:hypothetical protein
MNAAGKPAILAMLDQADDVLVALIKKSSAKAIKNGLAGHYQRTEIPQDLIEFMAGFAPSPGEPKDRRVVSKRRTKKSAKRFEPTSERQAS